MDERPRRHRYLCRGLRYRTQRQRRNRDAQSGRGTTDPRLRCSRNRSRGWVVTDFVLVPGAGGLATLYWRRVSVLLEEAGHGALPIDPPGDSPDASLPEYAAIIIDAIEGCADPVVVSQSMGGFGAVMACDRVPARMLILVNAMVPAPGETPGAW